MPNVETNEKVGRHHRDKGGRNGENVMNARPTRHQDAASQSMERITRSRDGQQNRYMPNTSRNRSRSRSRKTRSRSRSTSRSRSKSEQVTKHANHPRSSQISPNVNVYKAVSSSGSRNASPIYVTHVPEDKRGNYANTVSPRIRKGDFERSHSSPPRYKPNILEKVTAERLHANVNPGDFRNLQELISKSKRVDSPVSEKRRDRSYDKTQNSESKDNAAKDRVSSRAKSEPRRLQNSSPEIIWSEDYGKGIGSPSIKIKKKREHSPTTEDGPKKSPHKQTKHNKKPKSPLPYGKSKSKKKSPISVSDEHSFKKKQSRDPNDLTSPQIREKTKARERTNDNLKHLNDGKRSPVSVFDEKLFREKQSRKRNYSTSPQINDKSNARERTNDNLKHLNDGKRSPLFVFDEKLFREKQSRKRNDPTSPQIRDKSNERDRNNDNLKSMNDNKRSPVSVYDSKVFKEKQSRKRNELTSPQIRDTSNERDRNNDNLKSMNDNKRSPVSVYDSKVFKEKQSRKCNELTSPPIRDESNAEGRNNDNLKSMNDSKRSPASVSYERAFKERQSRKRNDPTSPQIRDKSNERDRNNDNLKSMNDGKRSPVSEYDESRMKNKHVINHRELTSDLIDNNQLQNTEKEKVYSITVDSNCQANDVPNNESPPILPHRTQRLKNYGSPPQCSPTSVGTEHNPCISPKVQMKSHGLESPITSLALDSLSKNRATPDNNRTPMQSDDSRNGTKHRETIEQDDKVVGAENALTDVVSYADIPQSEKVSTVYLGKDTKRLEDESGELSKNEYNDAKRLHKKTQDSVGSTHQTTEEIKGSTIIRLPSTTNVNYEAHLHLDSKRSTSPFRVKTTNPSCIDEHKDIVTSPSMTEEDQHSIKRSTSTISARSREHSISPNITKHMDQAKTAVRGPSPNRLKSTKALSPPKNSANETGPGKNKNIRYPWLSQPKSKESTDNVSSIQNNQLPPSILPEDNTPYLAPSWCDQPRRNNRVVGKYGEIYKLRIKGGVNPNDAGQDDDNAEIKTDCPILADNVAACVECIHGRWKPPAIPSITEPTPTEPTEYTDEPEESSLAARIKFNPPPPGFRRDGSTVEDPLPVAKVVADPVSPCMSRRIIEGCQEKRLTTSPPPYRIKVVGPVEKKNKKQKNDDKEKPEGTDLCVFPPGQFDPNQDSSDNKSQLSTRSKEQMGIIDSCMGSSSRTYKNKDQDKGDEFEPCGSSSVGSICESCVPLNPPVHKGSRKSKSSCSISDVSCKSAKRSRPRAKKKIICHNRSKKGSDGQGMGLVQDPCTGFFRDNSLNDTGTGIFGALTRVIGGQLQQIAMSKCRYSYPSRSGFYRLDDTIVGWVGSNCLQQEERSNTSLSSRTSEKTTTQKVPTHQTDSDDTSRDQTTSFLSNETSQVRDRIVKKIQQHRDPSNSKGSTIRGTISGSKSASSKQIAYDQSQTVASSKFSSATTQNTEGKISRVTSRSASKDVTTREQSRESLRVKTPLLESSIQSDRVSRVITPEQSEISEIREDHLSTVPTSKDQSRSTMYSSKDQSRSTIIPSKDQSRSTTVPSKDQSRSTMPVSKEQSRSTMSGSKEQSRSTLSGSKEQSRSTMSGSKEQSRSTMSGSKEQSRSTIPLDSPQSTVPPSTYQSRSTLPPSHDASRSTVPPSVRQSHQSGRNAASFDNEVPSAYERSDVSVSDVQDMPASTYPDLCDRDKVESISSSHESVEPVQAIAKPACTGMRKLEIRIRSPDTKGQCNTTFIINPYDNKERNVSFQKGQCYSGSDTSGRCMEFYSKRDTGAACRANRCDPCPEITAALGRMQSPASNYLSIRRPLSNSEFTCNSHTRGRGFASIRNRSSGCDPSTDSLISSPSPTHRRISRGSDYSTGSYMFDKAQLRNNERNRSPRGRFASSSHEDLSIPNQSRKTLSSSIRCWENESLGASETTIIDKGQHGMKLKVASPTTIRINSSDEMAGKSKTNKTTVNIHLRTPKPNLKQDERKHKTWRQDADSFCTNGRTKESSDQRKGAVNASEDEEDDEVQELRNHRKTRESRQSRSDESSMVTDDQYLPEQHRHMRSTYLKYSPINDAPHRRSAKSDSMLSSRNISKEQLQDGHRFRPSENRHESPELQEDHDTASSHSDIDTFGRDSRPVSQVRRSGSDCSVYMDECHDNTRFPPKRHLKGRIAIKRFKQTDNPRCDGSPKKRNINVCLKYTKDEKRPTMDENGDPAESIDSWRDCDDIVTSNHRKHREMQSSGIPSNGHKLSRRSSDMYGSHTSGENMFSPREGSRLYRQTLSQKSPFSSPVRYTSMKYPSSFHRSRSNSAKRKDNSETSRESIDVFNRIITPEQPMPVSKDTEHCSPGTGYLDDQDRRSSERESKSRYSRQTNRSSFSSITSTFDNYECASEDLHSYESSQIDHGRATRRSKRRICYDDDSFGFPSQTESSDFSLGSHNMQIWSENKNASSNSGMYRSPSRDRGTIEQNHAYQKGINDALAFVMRRSTPTNPPCQSISGEFVEEISVHHGASTSMEIRSHENEKHQSSLDDTNERNENSSFERNDGHNHCEPLNQSMLKDWISISKSLCSTMSKKDLKPNDSVIIDILRKILSLTDGVDLNTPDSSLEVQTKILKGSGDSKCTGKFQKRNKRRTSRTKRNYNERFDSEDRMPCDPGFISSDSGSSPVKSSLALKHLSELQNKPEDNEICVANMTEMYVSNSPKKQSTDILRNVEIDRTTANDIGIQVCLGKKGLLLKSEVCVHACYPALSGCTTEKSDYSNVDDSLDDNIVKVSVHGKDCSKSDDVTSDDKALRCSVAGEDHTNIEDGENVAPGENERSESHSSGNPETIRDIPSCFSHSSPSTVPSCENHDSESGLDDKNQCASKRSNTTELLSSCQKKLQCITSQRLLNGNGSENSEDLEPQNTRYTHDNTDNDGYNMIRGNVNRLDHILEQNEKKDHTKHFQIENVGTSCQNETNKHDETDFDSQNPLTTQAGRDKKDMSNVRDTKQFNLVEQVSNKCINSIRDGSIHLRRYGHTYPVFDSFFRDPDDDNHPLRSEKDLISPSSHCDIAADCTSFLIQSPKIVHPRLQVQACSNSFSERFHMENKMLVNNSHSDKSLMHWVAGTLRSEVKNLGSKLYQPFVPTPQYGAAKSALRGSSVDFMSDNGDNPDVACHRLPTIRFSQHAAEVNTYNRFPEECGIFSARMPFKRKRRRSIKRTRRMSPLKTRMSINRRLGRDILNRHIVGHVLLQNRIKRNRQSFSFDRRCRRKNNRRPRMAKCRAVKRMGLKQCKVNVEPSRFDPEDNAAIYTTDNFTSCGLSKLGRRLNEDIISEDTNSLISQVEEENSPADSCNDGIEDLKEFISDEIPMDGYDSSTDANIFYVIHSTDINQTEKSNSSSEYNNILQLSPISEESQVEDTESEIVSPEAAARKKMRELSNQMGILKTDEKFINVTNVRTQDRVVKEPKAANKDPFEHALKNEGPANFMNEEELYESDETNISSSCAASVEEPMCHTNVSLGCSKAIDLGLDSAASGSGPRYKSNFLREQGYELTRPIFRIPSRTGSLGPIKYNNHCFEITDGNSKFNEGIMYTDNCGNRREMGISNNSKYTSRSACSLQSEDDYSAHKDFISNDYMLRSKSLSLSRSNSGLLKHDFAIYRSDYLRNAFSSTPSMPKRLLESNQKTYSFANKRKTLYLDPLDESRWNYPIKYVGNWNENANTNSLTPNKDTFSNSSKEISFEVSPHIFSAQMSFSTDESISNDVEHCFDAHSHPLYCGTSNGVSKNRSFGLSQHIADFAHQNVNGSGNIFDRSSSSNDTDIYSRGVQTQDSKNDVPRHQMMSGVEEDDTPYIQHLSFVNGLEACEVGSWVEDLCNHRLYSHARDSYGEPEQDPTSYNYNYNDIQGMKKGSCCIPKIQQHNMPNGIRHNSEAGMCSSNNRSEEDGRKNGRGQRPLFIPFIKNNSQHQHHHHNHQHQHHGKQQQSQPFYQYFSDKSTHGQGDIFPMNRPAATNWYVEDGLSELKSDARGVGEQKEAIKEKVSEPVSAWSGEPDRVICGSEGLGSDYGSEEDSDEESASWDDDQYSNPGLVSDEEDEEEFSDCDCEDKGEKNAENAHKNNAQNILQEAKNLKCASFAKEECPKLNTTQNKNSRRKQIKDQTLDGKRSRQISITQNSGNLNKTTGLPIKGRGGGGRNRRPDVHLEQPSTKMSSRQPATLKDVQVQNVSKERVRFACDENGEWAEIGRGSYGCVYLGLLDGVVEVAIKDFYESNSYDQVIHEARMLAFLQETGITPKFYGLRKRFDVSKQPGEFCIIMEYFGEGKTLFNVLSEKIELTFDEWLDVLGQLVAGLRLIHRRNVLLNDLKADNILIDLCGGRKAIRYIDVGMATYKHGLTFLLPQEQMGKYNFLAPEVRDGAHTSRKSDIYSLGYMLDQMTKLAGPALHGLNDIIQACLDANPKRRPSVDKIMSHVHKFILAKTRGKMVNPKNTVSLSSSV